MDFTQQELINMVYCIGEADRNVLLASRIYRQKYPDARTPQVLSFQKLKDRFENSASTKFETKEILRGRIDQDTELNVLLMLEENPNLSTREISRGVIHETYLQIVTITATCNSVTEAYRDICNIIHKKIVSYRYLTG
ncbi:hypothetical protein TcasGA2_TC001924 [Tribolium castaneum]|uniref:DUF4817 domain-containing protein n=1 Tax=Tribolium castaneum TaxID=7070 RepID=D6X163_TRICA|nr:hypothetical protein TcasGA2_TC001924 [Tribolium castaneum]